MSHARVSAPEAHALLREGYDYLDVRTPEEFAAGHPEGAYNVPWQLRGAHGRAPNPHFLASVRAAFPIGHKLVVGCQTGQRSRPASEALIDAGYTETVEQRAGFDGARDAFGRVVDIGWRAAGLPCATRPLPGRDYTALERQGESGA